MIFSRLFFQLTRKSGLLNSALQCPDMPQLAINVAMPRLFFFQRNVLCSADKTRPNFQKWKNGRRKMTLVISACFTNDFSS